jgi:hypothetical protein
LLHPSGDAPDMREKHLAIALVHYDKIVGFLGTRDPFVSLGFRIRFSVAVTK